MVHLISSALCLLGILISSSFWGASAMQCSRGWMKYERYCYAYFDEKMTWSEAETECQSYGPKIHLASILNQRESSLISKHISTYKKTISNVWVGLHDMNENGRWKWIDGSISGWKSWHAAEPPKYGNTNFCVELCKCTEWKKWKTASCESKNSYICKYEV